MAAKLTYTQESDFRRERDFGAKISATFEFIAAHFKPLFKCIAYFVLPGALLLGIGFGLFMSKASGFYAAAIQGAQNGSSGPLTTDPLAMYRGSGGIGVVLIIIGGTLAFLLLTSTVYGYIRVRLNQPPTEPVQPAQVWAWIRPRLGRTVRAGLLLGGLVLAVLVAVGLVAGGVGAAAGNSGGGIALVVLLVFGVYGVLIWLTVTLSLYFPVLWLEDVGVMEALRRCFYLIKGKWWSTLGLSFVIGLIQGSISYIFIIPMYALMFLQALKVTSEESPVLMSGAALLYAGGYMLLSTLPLLAHSFQYFNLSERRDSLGSRQLLGRLGQTAAPQVSNLQYQADEEGEY